jgi:hypothetical protein
LNGSGFLGWDQAQNEYTNHEGAANGMLNTAIVGSLSSLSGPMTIIQVLKHNVIARKINEYLLTDDLGSRCAIGYTTTTQFIYYLATGLFANRIDKRYDSGGGLPFDNNLHLFVYDYDGSESHTGMRLFSDDMATPITPSSGSNVGTFVNTAPFLSRIYQGYFGSVSFTDFRGFIYETHIFNKVLSQAERETAKEILNQYYTIA